MFDWFPRQIQSAVTRWFIPHHAVYHPKKPDKIRVVFDCSCQYNGVSLNEELLQGPDLTSSLIGENKVMVSSRPWRILDLAEFRRAGLASPLCSPEAWPDD
jgi:hypothetical protein